MLKAYAAHRVSPLVGGWLTLLAVAVLAVVQPASRSQAGELPQVRFDVPHRLVAREVELPAGQAGGRLVEIAIPVSVRIVKGDIHRVQEVAIEIDATAEQLAVHDFSPRTTLQSELSGHIEVNHTQESAKAFDASLGGQSPLPLGDIVAQVTPTVSGGSKQRSVAVTKKRRLAPLRPIAVSGTFGSGQGVFFQLRPSSQTTLEGQHLLSVVLRVPENWQGGQLQVRCWARGERRILWFDQLQVWGNSRSEVEVSLPEKLAVETGSREKPERNALVLPHRVAKPRISQLPVSKSGSTEERSGKWVPAKATKAR